MKFHLLIYFFFPIFLFSQEPHKQTIKSKIKELESLKRDNVYNEKRLISLCKELYSVSKEEGNKNGMLVSLVELSKIYINTDDADNCLKTANEGLVLAKELKNDKYHCSLLTDEGRALLLAGDYISSRVSFSRSLKTADLIKNKDTMHSNRTSIYNALVYYFILSDEMYKNTGYKDSILYFAKQGYSESLKASRLYLRKNTLVGQSAQILGSAYAISGNLTEGDRYFNIAEKLFINVPDKRYLAGLYASIGYTELVKKNDEKALIYFQKALDLSKSIKKGLWILRFTIGLQIIIRK